MCTPIVIGGYWERRYEATDPDTGYFDANDVWGAPVQSQTSAQGITVTNGGANRFIVNAPAGLRVGSVVDATFTVRLHPSNWQFGSTCQIQAYQYCTRLREWSPAQTEGKQSLPKQSCYIVCAARFRVDANSDVQIRLDPGFYAGNVAEIAMVSISYVPL